MTSDAVNWVPCERAGQSLDAHNLSFFLALRRIRPGSHLPGRMRPPKLYFHPAVAATFPVAQVQRLSVRQTGWSWGFDWRHGLNTKSFRTQNHDFPGTAPCVQPRGAGSVVSRTTAIVIGTSGRVIILIPRCRNVRRNCVSLLTTSSCSDTVRFCTTKKQNRLTNFGRRKSSSQASIPECKDESDSTPAGLSSSLIDVRPVSHNVNSSIHYSDLVL